MPYYDTTNYQPTFPFRNKHWSTIYPSIFRKLPEVIYERERIELPDGDFIDVDWSRKEGRHLVVVLHGLEGSADRPYVRGIIRVMNRAGWDGVGLNFRGCSGTPNRLPRGYHSGETGDIKFLVEKIMAEANYETINLVGFSLGGNVTMKFLGELGNQLPAPIKRAVGISVPLDLYGSCLEIQQFHNRIYLHSFFVMLINALNDTFLSETSYPIELAKKSKNIHLVTPKYGGHVGFVTRHPENIYWTEEMVRNFFIENTNSRRGNVFRIAS